MRVPDELAEDPEFLEFLREQGVDGIVDRYVDQFRERRRQAIGPTTDTSPLHTEANVQKATATTKDPNVNVATRKRTHDEKDDDPGSVVSTLSICSCFLLPSVIFNRF